MGSPFPKAKLFCCGALCLVEQILKTYLLVNRTLICSLYILIEGGLQPSRRRSLFTLASYMLIFSARAGDLPELIPIFKASLTDRLVSFYALPFRLRPFHFYIMLWYDFVFWAWIFVIWIVHNLQVDPCLQLVDDIWLRAVSIESEKEKISYGTVQEDEVAAIKSLSAVELDDHLLKETVISHFMNKFAKLSEVILLFPNIIAHAHSFIAASFDLVDSSNA